MNCPPLLTTIGSFGGVSFLAWYVAQRIEYARGVARCRRIDAEYRAKGPPPATWHRYRCEDCGSVVPLMGIDGKPCPVGKPQGKPQS